MTDLWGPFQEILINLWVLLKLLVNGLLGWSLGIAWFAWWLWGVNWKQTWPVLRYGAWIVVLLVMLTTALIWSEISPSECSCLSILTVPNFWWQLGAVSLLTGLTLVCGWLQGVMGWTPEAIDLDPPPAASHGHEA